MLVELLLRGISGADTGAAGAADCLANAEVGKVECDACLQNAMGRPGLGNDEYEVADVSVSAGEVAERSVELVTEGAYVEPPASESL